MTTLNFALSRTAAREWGAGDEVVATKLDHDANIAPWLELAQDKGLAVHFCDLDGEGRLDLDQLRSLVSERTKRGRVPVGVERGRHGHAGRRRSSTIAHEAGALAWVDAVHYAPHGTSRSRRSACDVLLCSPYKFYGPHLGLAAVRRELLEQLAARTRCARRRVPVRASGTRRGRSPHELLCGFVATVEYVHGVGWKFISEHERNARAAVPRRPPGRLDAARPADDGGPRVDLRDHAARGDARGRGDAPRRGRASRSGTATTTRSR